MKIKFTFLAIFFLSIVVSAQQSINYKAIIKDASGNIVTTPITIEFTILKGVAQTNVYQETFNTSPNANGLVVLNIGTGTIISGVFSDISWGSDDHFLNTQIDTGSGLVDMGTTQFMAVPYALHAKNGGFTSDSGITSSNVIADDFIAGSNQLDNVTGTDDDARLFLDKSKGAFRAGRVTGAHWDNANVGLWSTATGHNNTASAFYSVAFGSNSEASGQNSFVMGNNAISSALNSVAFGNDAEASGSSAIAIGNSAFSDGISSVAIGNNVQANENYSTALGANTIADGNYSLVAGFGTNAQSYAETVFGINNTIYTPTSTSAFNATDRLLVVGNGTASNAKSDALVILKNGTVTAPSFDLAEMTNNKALVTKEYIDSLDKSSINDTDNNTRLEVEASANDDKLTFTSNGTVELVANQDYFVFGSSTTDEQAPTNDNSRMFFDKTKSAFRAGGTAGTAAWDNANVGFGSSAFGYRNIASHFGSFTSGFDNATSASYQTVLGKYSAPSSSSIFVIANGTNASNRNNVFEVQTDGTIQTDKLIGTGIRNVKVNASGELISSPEPYQYYSVSPYDFHPYNQSDDIKRGNRGVYLNESNSSSIKSPIHLPEGATISQVKVVYIDDSPSNIHVSLLLKEIAGGRYGISTVMGEFNSVSSLSTQRTALITSIASPVIRNDLASYYLVVFPISGNWDNIDMTIMSIHIRYTLP